MGNLQKIAPVEIDPAEKDSFFIECSPDGIRYHHMMFDVFLCVYKRKAQCREQIVPLVLDFIDERMIRGRILHTNRTDIEIHSHLNTLLSQIRNGAQALRLHPYLLYTVTHVRLFWLLSAASTISTMRCPCSKSA